MNMAIEIQKSEDHDIKHRYKVKNMKNGYLE